MSLLPARPVVGILHPGAMGAALGSALKPRAGAVVWAAAGRSDATSKRAEIADLIGVPDVAELARRCDVVISICPPDAALEVAREVARSGRPFYVDANAVSPATVAAIGELFGPERVVDGAVIGAPAYERGRTELWLAGTAAAAVAELFEASPFDARVLGDGTPAALGAASALKACYALRSKAMPVIWMEMAEAARAYGITDALATALGRDGIDLDAEVATIERRSGDRAWRWAGEMDEAAATMAAVGLPDGFSRAAADWYRRTPRPGG